MQNSPGYKSQKDYAPDGSHLQTFEIYWQHVTSRSINDLINFTFFEKISDSCLQFDFLRESLRIDIEKRSLMHKRNGHWIKREDPLLELAVVMYLKAVSEVYPMGKDIVGLKDLKQGHFFQGPHEIKTDPLVEWYGNNPEAFQRDCLFLGASPVDMADKAFCLNPFPRIPIYYLLWTGDEEFNARIRILVDRSIEAVLPADAIWALINRVSKALTDIKDNL
ncbi:MAG: DUF3786 domain-containing protein [Desulfobacteraceae bacterium]|nr:DUF3786 domain-containing protein [Desulfobacteraceae bacterium]